MSLQWELLSYGPYGAPDVTPVGAIVLCFVLSVVLRFFTADLHVIVFYPVVYIMCVDRLCFFFLRFGRVLLARMKSQSTFKVIL